MPARGQSPGTSILTEMQQAVMSAVFVCRVSLYASERAGYGVSLVSMSLCGGIRYVSVSNEVHGQ